MPAHDAHRLPAVDRALQGRLGASGPGRCPRQPPRWASSQLCIHYGLQLLSSDRDFEAMARHCPLRLLRS